MAQYELKDLIKPLSEDECKAALYQMLEARGIKATSWKVGGIARSLTGAFCTMYAYGSYMVSLIAQSGFAELSTGKMLTLTARYVYNVERLDATFASGTVTVANSSATEYVLAAGDLVFSSTYTGKEYTAAAVTIPASGSTSVVVTANEAGTTANLVTAGRIDGFATPLPGVDITASTAVIGLDEETDPALRARCRGKMASLSIYGPADAFRYFAVSATRPDGTSCGVARTKLTKDGMGGITLHVATETGSLSVDDLAIVTTAAKKARTISDDLTVVNATAHILSVTYTVYLYTSANLSDAEVFEKTDAALAARIANLPIGGDDGALYISSLAGAIQASIPQIYRVDVTSPSGTSVAVGDSELVVLGALGRAVIWTPVPEGATYV